MLETACAGSKQILAFSAPLPGVLAVNLWCFLCAAKRQGSGRAELDTEKLAEIRGFEEVGMEMKAGRHGTIDAK